MTELRIRVDAATKAMIEENARKKGISMSEYAGTILADYMSAPEHRALEDRYTNAMKGIITSYQYLAQKLGEGKTVVTVLPDTAERYFSTILFDD